MRPWTANWMVGWFLLASTSSMAIEPIAIDHIENDTVFFRAPTATPSSTPLFPPVFSYKTGLSDLKPLGLLNTKKGHPIYLVATGKKCTDCPFESGVHLMEILSPQTAPSKPKAGMVHPGKVIDAKTGELLLESRTFFGACLPGKADVLVSFQREKVDRRSKLQTSVMIIEATDQGLHEKLLERHLPRLDAVLRVVKQKKCTEISGRNRHSIPKGAALFPGKAKLPDDDDNDDDNEPKENQTNAELKSGET